MMKKLRFTNILILLFVVLLVTWYALLWVSYASTPSALAEADFRAFYTAGSISNKYGMEHVYDMDLEMKMQGSITGDVISTKNLLTYNHPPIILPIMALISRFPYQTAYSVYSLLLISIAGISFIFLEKTFRSKNWATPAIKLMLISIILFEPLFFSILKGQDSVLLLLGLVIWFSGFIKKDDRLAGLGLALTVIRPQIAIFLAVPFLFRRQKFFWWFFLGASMLVIYSFLLVGKQGFLDYLNLLNLSSTGQEYGLNLSAMFNLTGLIVRLFPGIEYSALLGIIKWIIFGIALGGMIVVWIKSAEIKLHSMALLIVCSLFFSPHLHYHDLTALLIPMAAMLLVWVEQKVLSEKMAGFLSLLFSVIFLIGHNIDAVYFLLPYLIMIFLLSGVWFPKFYKNLINQFSLKWLKQIPE